MTIKVTQEHIHRGKKRQCNSCPVALAVLDAMPDAMYVTIGVRCGNIDLRSTGKYIGVFLPYEVGQFIRRFDEGVLPVEPFEFELEVKL